MPHGGVPDVRELSRREIDALVDDVLRGEDPRTSDGPRSTPRSTPRSSRRTRRRRGLAALAAIAVVIGGCSLLRPGSSAYVYDESGLPSHPTTYTSGSHRFLRMQPSAPNEPVGYNPCRHIDVEINFAYATPTIQADVVSTLRMIDRVSGLHLRYVGASLRTRNDQANGRLLVSFVRERDDTAMTDAIAGRGGSASYVDGLPGQTMYYIGGNVMLNADTFNVSASHGEQMLVLAHEFGHALGLAHAPGHEVMNADPWPFAPPHYQHGDLTGLAELGALPCQ